MKSGPITVEELRHRIDTLTPILPDQISRTEATALALAMYLHGTASVLEASPEIFPLSTRKVSARELRALAADLLASLKPAPPGE